MEVGSQAYPRSHSQGAHTPPQKEKSRPKGGVGSQAQLLSGSPLELVTLLPWVGRKGK